MTEVLYNGDSNTRVSSGHLSNDSNGIKMLATSTSTPSTSVAITNLNVQSQCKQQQPRRYESFLMTGEKIINLNQNISARFAEMHHEQLPPTATKLEEPKRGPFDGFAISQPPSAQNCPRKGWFNVESSVSCSQSDDLISNQRVLSNGSDLSNTQLSFLTVDGDSVNPINDVPSFISSSKRFSQSSDGANSSSNIYNLKELDNRAEQNIYELRSSVEISQSEPSCPETCLSKVSDISNRHIISSNMLGKDKRSEVDLNASCRLAKRLYTLDGFKKTDVAMHLSRMNNFGLAVAEEYCNLFNFSGIRLDAAIREFLSKFCLTGESQERARIIEHFANRYHRCNPALFKSSDQVHALTCGLLLLNSDLHGPNVRKKMSSRDFISNLSQTEYIYDRTLLKTLYASIKDYPLRWAEDGDVNSESVSMDSVQKLTSKARRQEFINRRSRIFDDDQIEYKAGWVVRKCLYDRDGSRTPFGRRNWRMMYARLRGTVLYLHKDEEGLRKRRYETFNNAIMLHHSLACPVHQYKKRQYVFKLRTANLGEMLFQTSNDSEVKEWIDTINYVAAAFSTPELPAPVSSQTNIFYRPLLPSAPTSLSITEQLQSHEVKEVEFAKLLEQLMRDAPPLQAKGNAVKDFFFKERYLYHERERYATYASLLRRKLMGVSTVSQLALEKRSATNSNFCYSSPCHSRVENVYRSSTGIKVDSEYDVVCVRRELLVSESNADRSSYKEAIIQSPRINQKIS